MIIPVLTAKKFRSYKGRSSSGEIGKQNGRSFYWMDYRKAIILGQFFDSGVGKH